LIFTAKLVGVSFVRVYGTAIGGENVVVLGTVVDGVSMTAGGG
jgi:hypothetical protein